jgi:hypothetical protein
MPSPLRLGTKAGRKGQQIFGVKKQLNDGYVHGKFGENDSNCCVPENRHEIIGKTTQV